MVDHLAQHAVLSLAEPTTFLSLDTHKLLPSLGPAVDVQHSSPLLRQHGGGATARGRGILPSCTGKLAGPMTLQRPRVLHPGEVATVCTHVLEGLIAERGVVHFTVPGRVLMSWCRVIFTAFGDKGPLGEEREGCLLQGMLCGFLKFSTMLLSSAVGIACLWLSSTKSSWPAMLLRNWRSSADVRLSFISSSPPGSLPSTLREHPVSDTVRG